MEMAVNYELVGQHDFAAGVELKEPIPKLSNNNFCVIVNVKFWLKIVVSHELVLVGQHDVAADVELKESKTKLSNYNFGA